MKHFLLFLLTLLWTSVAQAADEPTLVIQVPATFYQHPTRLINPRIDYWHNRGKAAEKAGLTAFQDQHYQTASCKSGASGQAFIVIVPDMFYNPQRGVFHAQVLARVYTQPAADESAGKPVLTVKGEGEARGWLSSGAENFTHKAYRQAFDSVIEQLQKEPVFRQALDKTQLQSYQVLCDSMDTLTQAGSGAF